jgi:chromosome segregation ATPase
LTKVSQNLSRKKTRNSKREQKSLGLDCAKENKKLKDAAFQDVQEVDVKFLREQIEELKEEKKKLKKQKKVWMDSHAKFMLENKKLKEENKELKDLCDKQVKAYALAVSRYPEVKNEVEELKEENEKLKKKITTMDYQIDRLKGENSKKGACDDIGEMFMRKAKEMKEYNEKLKEEIENLKEELEEANCSMPDLCVDCDCLFDLHSAMNKITCEEDEGLRKKYDEYFGSDNDRGDLCRQCIREELP